MLQLNPSYNFNDLLITQGQTYKNSLLIADPHYRVLSITNMISSPNNIAIKSAQIIIQECLPGCAECSNSNECTKCLPRNLLKLGNQCITQCGDVVLLLIHLKAIANL
ncbi:hypothetical protein TTHERM_00578450 (macronuclear) [Tetrahymena thermophila SB210]|uniref:Uncharacterized protein n=1 Tax=Tetrahymena thermophila (strain SB210) TaxID=312017 RepID=I7LWP5_TETTS|nr:hypothetical protein TTHERM_00578450 [Tetrahymena thermophila SB210]EAS02601.2 hypothetical protein TTHERM_00578450 [Tetrahymena thermophila SB210]|eukprot:XP_001022846.2 hypothetical protein TTHERM_00578450 [Tetrahymena thermophila SB210]